MAVNRRRMIIHNQHDILESMRIQWTDLEALGLVDDTVPPFLEFCAEIWGMFDRAPEVFDGLPDQWDNIRMWSIDQTPVGPITVFLKGTDDGDTVEIYGVHLPSGDP